MGYETRAQAIAASQHGAIQEKNDNKFLGLFQPHNTIILNYDGSGKFGDTDDRSGYQIQQDHDNRERYINRPDDDVPWRPTRSGDRTFGRQDPGVTNLLVGELGGGGAWVIGDDMYAGEDIYGLSGHRAVNPLITGRGSDQYIERGTMRKVDGLTYYSTEDTILGQIADGKFTGDRAVETDTKTWKAAQDLDISVYNTATWNELMINHPHYYNEICSHRWLSANDVGKIMSCDEAQQRRYAFETTSNALCAESAVDMIPGVGGACREGQVLWDLNQGNDTHIEGDKDYFGYLKQYNEEGMAFDWAADAVLLAGEGAKATWGKVAVKTVAKTGKDVVDDIRLIGVDDKVVAEELARGELSEIAKFDLIAKSGEEAAANRRKSIAAAMSAYEENQKAALAEARAKFARPKPSGGNVGGNWRNFAPITSTDIPDGVIGDGVDVDGRQNGDWWSLESDGKGDDPKVGDGKGDDANDGGGDDGGGDDGGGDDGGGDDDPKVDDGKGGDDDSNTVALGIASVVNLYGQTKGPESQGRAIPRSQRPTVSQDDGPTKQIYHTDDWVDAHPVSDGGDGMSVGEGSTILGWIVIITGVYISYRVIRHNL